ncbi:MULTISPECIES: DUF5827 family protein [unclassified Haladaptatus]|uniref:DUF5827 family protein n=1 Tax=unclassified Haladaptatus TaxID=2622732 RepID=UPI0023E8AA0E|nr:MULTISPECIES: DUF5827 family protein [unclassified Haladaptatus]
MPRDKDAFENIRPLDFRSPAEVLDDDKMYTVFEIARMLQGLEPDHDLDYDTEDVLLSWAIPWVMVNADELSFADPQSDEDPGFYGLR